MAGCKLGSIALFAGLALLGPTASAFDDVPNVPPTVSMAEGTVNGKPALCATITDADGEGDLLGYGFEYTMDDGTIYKNPLLITIYFIVKRGLTVTSVTDGKQICFTKLPGNCKSVRVIGTDSEFQVGSGSATVPAAVRAGNPKFGVKR